MRHFPSVCLSCITHTNCMADRINCVRNMNKELWLWQVGLIANVKLHFFNDLRGKIEIFLFCSFSCRLRDLTFIIGGRGVKYLRTPPPQIEIFSYTPCSIVFQFFFGHPPPLKFNFFQTPPQMLKRFAHPSQCTPHNDKGTWTLIGNQFFWTPSLRFSSIFFYTPPTRLAHGQSQKKWQYSVTGGLIILLFRGRP